MKKHLRDAIKNAWDVTVTCNAIETMLLNVRHYLDGGSIYNSDAKVAEAIETVRMAVIKKELDGWRSALMWLASDEIPDDQRKEIREAVYQRFLGEGMSIMHHLEPGRGHPTRWSGEVEEQFREEIRLAFGVKGD